MHKLTQKKILGIACIAAFAFMIFLMPAAAQAQSFVGEWIYGNVLKAISSLLYYTFYIFGWLLWLAAGLLDFVLTNPTLQKFTSAPFVQDGWKITRDLANMFFSLILIAIAFATILKIDTYGVKNNLKNIILIALLINFSLVIAGVIIDFAQVLTNYFVTAAKGDNASITAMLANGLNITSGFDPSKAPRDLELKDTFQGFLTIGLGLFGQTIFVLVAAFTMFAAVIFLIVRFVAIWFLLMLSPIVWLFYILPNTRKYWNQWWEAFMKWVFFAPAYTFFLYLSLMAVSKGALVSQVGFVMDQSGQTFIGKSFEVIISYIILIGFLIASLIVAQKAGVAGSHGVIAVGRGMSRAVGGAVSNWAARGAEKDITGKGFIRGAGAGLRRGISYLSPEAWKTAWRQRQEQTKRESIPIAAGRRQDLLNRVLSLSWFKGQPGEKTDYRERAARSRRAEERKNIYTNNAEELIRGFLDAKKSGNANKMNAYVQALSEQNDQNELFKALNKTEGKNYAMTARGVTDFVEEQLKPAMGEQQAYRFGHDMIRMMESNGQWIGRPFAANASGKYELSGVEGVAGKKAAWGDLNEEQKKAVMELAAQNAHVEWTKQDPQKQSINTGRFSYIDEEYELGANGEIDTIDGGLTTAGLQKLSMIQPSQANRLNTHSKAMLMTFHADEFKKTNAGVFNKIMEDMTAAVRGMDKPGIENFVANFTQPIAHITSVIRDKNGKEVRRVSADEARANFVKMIEDAQAEKGDNAKPKGGPAGFNP
ncbi:MAG: hypothetical protein PHQ47_00025 [Candidatus Portnoybacteria bacterium]|nr:hypothetical protein [Candidatus Portnoybacteria bacterium]